MGSHTWPIQNPAAEALALAGPEQCSRLGTQVQETLGRNILQAADGNAYSAVQLLVSLGEGKNEWPESFIKGVLFEAVANEEDELRFKPRCFTGALVATLGLPDQRSCIIVDEAAKAVKESKPKYGWIAKSDSEKMQDAISQARSKATTKEQRRALRKLATAIGNVAKKFVDFPF